MDQTFTPDPVNPQTLNFTDDDGTHWSQIIPPAIQVTAQSYDDQIATHQANITVLNNEIAGYDNSTADLANRKTQDLATISNEQAIINQLTEQKNQQFPS